MAKTLMLHIGHHKTGSSYLQSVLARNIPTLREHGIDYPAGLLTEKSAAGAISSGNIGPFEATLSDPEQLTKNASASVLYSSEVIFQRFTDMDFRKRFADYVQESGVDQVRILMFIRDPVSFSISAFQQYIKGGILSKVSVSNVLLTDPRPALVNDFLDFSDSLPRTVVTVRNYSAVRSTLVDEFCAWLGVPPKALSLPDAKVVNRSMTSSELMLLAAMNLHVDKSSNLIADALCNRLPDVVSDDMRPPIEDQLAMWERLGPEIDRVNARVDPAHRYDKARDINPPNIMPDHAEFSAAQIQVIAETVADLIQKERDLRTNYRESLERNKDQQARVLMQRGVIEELRAQALKQRGVIEDLQARLGKRPGATGDAGTKDPAPQGQARGPSQG